MARLAAGHGLRDTNKRSYAESSDDESAKSTSSFEGDRVSSRTSESDESGDELNDENDTIHVTQSHRDATRSLPARATRNGRPTYVPPKARKSKKKGKKTSSRSKQILTSDTLNQVDNHEPAAETARNKVRSDIATFTKPKRDAFVLAHQEYFLPLLPQNNQVAKLKRLESNEDTLNINAKPGIVIHTPLTKQPQGIQATMKPYQLEGLSFLVHMYNNGMPAILGDEMGLGKTLQTLSLFQHIAENTVSAGENRPNLVVCPLSVLSSWINESSKWAPGLHVIRFHGPKLERDRIKQQCAPAKSGRPRKDGKKTERSTRPIDLVVTTYETFISEQNWFKRAFVWRYCVLDEGHKIKNEKSDISSALQGLSSEFRLLLTGTPLQNNLREMWALLHWLLPEVFTLDTSENFKKAFDLSRGTVSTAFMDSARQILELLMLRRLKSTPGVNLGLPPKEEYLLYIPLTPMQRFWYTRLLTKSDNATLQGLFGGTRDKERHALEHDRNDQQLVLLEKASAAIDAAGVSGDDGVWAESRAIMEQAIQADQTHESKSNWQKLMNLLMQLRKVCIHPYLMPNAAPEDYLIGEHVKNASGKFIVLDKIIDQLVLKQRKKVLIFSGFTTCLNLCEDLLRLKGGNHSDAFRYGRLDGSTQRAQRNLCIRMFNDKTCNLQVMLLSTRAGGLGINLTSATDVVFMDEDWNPQITLQAEARAHRIGQTQKVTIYKLCSQGTIEEQMMGRIRKKLYLSAKIMESMRNIHSVDSTGKKRKFEATATSATDDAPHLDTASLQSLIRRGAQTLARPQIDVTDMLSWDWETTLENCRDKPMDMLAEGTSGAGGDQPIDEEQWLNTIEKVETAVFEGKKHHKQMEQAAASEELVRSARREGKNTTINVGGYMISKESMLCGDWEAVPTFAGKDPRLAEPMREKKPPVPHQPHCQACWASPRTTGDTIPCAGCPRVYHMACVGSVKGVTASNGFTRFYCSQHQCVQCDAKTGEAGGLLYRCRWCPNAFCEDCLDWSNTALLDHSLPELQMIGFGVVDQAFWIECPSCVQRMKSSHATHDVTFARRVENRHDKIQREWKAHLAELDAEAAAVPALAYGSHTPGDGASPATPPPFHPPPSHKKPRLS